MTYITPSQFKTHELVGKTDGTANTTKTFRHNRNETPWMWLVLEGNVYIPRNGAGPNTIDVRSDNQDEEFKLLLFFF